MAADRGTREDDNSSKESKDITDVSQPPPKGTCKKNGMTQACRCNGKPCRSMDVKRCKTPKDSRVNGVSTKIPASLSLSIPTLRSRSLTNNNRTRAEKSSVLLESPPKKRRSTRKDKPGLGERFVSVYEYGVGMAMKFCLAAFWWRRQQGPENNNVLVWEKLLTSLTKIEVTSRRSTHCAWL